jgi:hypothetical protein
MGTYWERTGPHQREYDQFYAELVPDTGMSQTIEGELLSAASRLCYDYWNNGGGNNVSGAFYFLRQHLPFFKQEWTDALIPFVAGSGGIFCSNVQLRAVEEIVDTAVQFVISREGDLRKNHQSFRDLNVKETGYEISEWTAEDRRETLKENGREPPVEPDYVSYTFHM